MLVPFKALTFVNFFYFLLLVEVIKAHCKIKKEKKIIRNKNERINRYFMDYIVVAASAKIN